MKSDSLVPIGHEGIAVAREKFHELRMNEEFFLAETLLA